MSLQSINLRKLLKLMFLQGPRLVTALRTDIREDRDRESGSAEGGGDFYGPFWKDAKDHVFGDTDLRDTTRIRIEGNDKRANLYPQLRDGFLLWWDERRRWTNAPFQRVDVPKSRFQVPGLDTTVKVDCMLAVRDGRGDDYYVYPYWFPQPELSVEAARLGLWLLGQALPRIPAGELRILDTIRGRTYALDRTPLLGNEAAVFARRYTAIAELRRALRDEYDH